MVGVAAWCLSLTWRWRGVGTPTSLNEGRGVGGAVTWRRSFVVGVLQWALVGSGRDVAVDASGGGCGT
jgi:hypothetical protein